MPSKLTLSSCALLAAIRASPGPSGHALARELSITRQSVQYQLDKLTALGLVERVVARRGRQSSPTGLTDARRAALTAAHLRVAALEASALDDIPSVEQRTTLAVLEKLRTSLTRGRS